MLDGLKSEEFCISPRILRFDGVWVGEFKSSECGSIFSLKFVVTASSFLRFVALLPESILKVTGINLEEAEM